MSRRPIHRTGANGRRRVRSDGRRRRPEEAGEPDQAGRAHDRSGSGGRRLALSGSPGAIARAPTTPIPTAAPSSSRRRLPGTVVSLDVTDNQFVKKGQPLIHIDPRQYQNDREQAEGALATAKAQYDGQQLGAEVARKNFPAQLEQAQAQLASRQGEARQGAGRLRPAASAEPAGDVAAGRRRRHRGAASRRRRRSRWPKRRWRRIRPCRSGSARPNKPVGQLKGQVEQAQASLDQAELNLSWTVVQGAAGRLDHQAQCRSRQLRPAGPADFLDRRARSAGSPPISRKASSTGMRPGQTVKIEVDAYPSLEARGHVDSIQQGSGSKFTAFPPENATGNFVKVVQRVPVKIVIDSGLDPNLPLPLGISVEPTVTVQ